MEHAVALMPVNLIRDEPGLCFEAGKRAGIELRVHPHLFRHARATHMLDAGQRVGDKHKKQQRSGAASQATGALFCVVG